ncbi:hypothetical protein LIA77_06845 [Sarocladium implicatum]|nr:hypothetical protein LIA77_06845 [Sarocladium implicatum]
MPSRLQDEDNVEDGPLMIALGKAIWSWNVCRACDAGNGAACVGSECVQSRAPRLQRYLRYYRTIASTYHEEISSDEEGLHTREFILGVMAQLKAKPDETLLGHAYSVSKAQYLTATLEDAIRIVLKLLIMVDSSEQYCDTSRLELGTFRTTWNNGAALSDYLKTIFPTDRDNILNHKDSEQSKEIKRKLNAVNLERTLGITIIPTSDIQSHLRWNRTTNILEVYHFTSFLKEQLRVTKNEKDCEDFVSALHLGSLPRQLVLEVLDSLQNVLFPIGDRKSKKLLQSLVATSDFDPDILRVEVSSVRRAGEETIPYLYLAERLTDLYDELQSTRPRSRFEQILERKSGARYVMLATLIGVMFAVLLGILSLGVSSYQTYIAYQAWKHPVSPPET